MVRVMEAYTTVAKLGYPINPSLAAVWMVWLFTLRCRPDPRRGIGADLGEIGRAPASSLSVVTARTAGPHLCRQDVIGFLLSKLDNLVNAINNSKSD